MGGGWGGYEEIVNEEVVGSLAIANAIGITFKLGMRQVLSNKLRYDGLA